MTSSTLSASDTAMHGDIRFQHQAILASAGSGKTYQLTNRFLRLIKAGAEPDSILASTFTRAAAGEILERILNELAEAYTDEGKQEQIAERLGERSVSRKDILALLSKIAQNVHRLQIRTLDSFFATVARVFSAELGLPLGPEVIDENQAATLRAEAIRRMLDEREPQKLVDLLRRLVNDESKRAVTEEIDAVVSNLYALSREAEPSAWECVHKAAGRMSDSQLNDAINALQQCTLPTTLKGAVDSNFQRAISTAVVYVNSRDWQQFVSKGIVDGLLNKGGTYYTKQISTELLAVFQPLIDHARAHFVSLIRRQNLATRELLQLYGEKYEALKRERRVLTFSDLAFACSQANQLGKSDDIGYRIDAKLHHLLFDEFQDTSIIQWKALKPIVEEVISQEAGERTFFCVGDVKQCLYTWRDAEPELLTNIADRLKADTPLRLVKSYRSSQVIIDAVNTVFNSLDQNDALMDFAAVREVWKTWFTDHQTAKTKLSGYVEIRTPTEGANKGDRTVARMQIAAKLAAEIHEKNPKKSIGILTRRNKVIPRLMYELGPMGQNLPAGARGEGQVTDAPPVTAILDLLQLADHPDDTVAAFHVAQTPLGAFLQFNNFADKDVRTQLASQTRKRIQQDGLASYIAYLAEGVSTSCDQREFERLMQLVELTERFESQSSSNPSDFIRYAETAKPTASSRTTIEVMTIHQSKGLDFDVVILPELDEALVGRPPKVVYEREAQSGKVKRMSRYIGNDLQPLVPELQDLVQLHQFRAVRESLCVLYVAMTRAKQALFMLIDPPAIIKNGSRLTTCPKSLAGVVRSAFQLSEIQPDSVVYSSPPSNWIESTDSPRDAVVESTPIREIKLARGSRRPRKAVSPSIAHASEVFSIENTDARDRGRVIHALLCTIEWINDWQHDRAELVHVATIECPRRDETWIAKRVDEFLAIVKKPTIHGLLSRPQDNCVVVREQPYAHIDNDLLSTGRVDRLVVDLNSQHRPNGATIYDFKTDAVEASRIQGHAETYRSQMESYRDAVMDMYGLNREAVKMNVVFVHVDKVVELS